MSQVSAVLVDVWNRPRDKKHIVFRCRRKFLVRRMERKGVKLILALAFALLFSDALQAKKPERYYQERWCTTWSGKTEVRMSDGTRCDCVTSTHAVELDFAKKWYEAIGQSLNYARQMNRRAGVVIVHQGAKDANKLKSLEDTILFYQLPIDVWHMPVHRR